MVKRTPQELIERFMLRVVKDAAGCWIWQGYCDRKGYARASECVYGEQYGNRAAYKIFVGPIPKGMFVDHTCHVPSCVNPAHLRLATNKQNVENHSGATSLSKSGVRGVHWRKDAKKWQAMVRHEGKLHHVGYFSTLDAAAAAVAMKRNELHSYNDADRVSPS
jgi:hypothetical protein